MCCQICMNKFDHGDRLPLCLKCGHTICKDCAKSLLKYRKIKCPFDNSVCEYATIDQVGKNFTLLDMIEAEKNKKMQSDERPCTLHPKKKVKFYCKEHSEFVCSQCLLDQHLGHSVVPAKPLIMAQVVAINTQSAKETLIDLRDQLTKHATDMETDCAKAQEQLELAGK